MRSSSDVICLRRGRSSKAQLSRSPLRCRRSDTSRRPASAWSATCRGCSSSSRDGYGSRTRSCFTRPLHSSSRSLLVSRRHASHLSRRLSTSCSDRLMVLATKTSASRHGWTLRALTGCRRRSAHSRSRTTKYRSLNDRRAARLQPGRSRSTTRKRRYRLSLPRWPRRSGRSDTIKQRRARRRSGPRQTASWGSKKVPSSRSSNFLPAQPAHPSHRFLVVPPGHPSAVTSPKMTGLSSTLQHPSPNSS